ncbi:MAG: HIT domain-containing protein [Chitinivibrionales bacterium]|nr:HIT domain-containing protein [Chitinivibrionales bacterium]MBD3356292.1 HIT domain-containing protein [Chitinivibrionales bacterium]
MNQIWAPWRMTYIAGIDKNDDGCVFCRKPQGADDEEGLILYRGKRCYVLQNLYPYNNGHLMIVPYTHTSDPATLDDESSLELWRLTMKSKAALKAAFHPDGFNIGMNIERVAGAGIDQHIHLHIVPRWSGDTNFMPVVGETKVISQALSDTYKALKRYFVAEN